MARCNRVRPSPSIARLRTVGCYVRKRPTLISAGTRPLLNARGAAPDLVIDPRLEGTYDVYAQVRAVHAGGASQTNASFAALSTMAFGLALDDASENEIVMAKGFPTHHFDTEVIAGHRWNLTGRKIVLRSLGKPVYL